MSETSTKNFLEDIAIIGMVGRFPGARDVDEFWQNLCEGKDSISSFSDEEVERAGVGRAMLSNSNYVKAGGVIEDVESFDAAFFGFTPREAEVMDPQQRVFLECAWSALENAGYDSETYHGKIGIYAGSGINGYLLNLVSNADRLEAVGALQAIIGNEKDHLTTQVSYKLNLRGPSVAIQTTCSTSLVAVSLACQSLLCYQSDMVLAGGVSVRVPQRSGYLYREGGISSPDGRCRTFDARAKGIVSGDGVGVVVLKRFADALADGDCIHAVIKGSAINNDGSLKVGYTAPSIDGQAEAIAEALAMARINPETVTYLEAHGTGTTLGDPIEVAALTQAFGAVTGKRGFCAIGSVKTNIGHLNTAAGVAGLIKTTLALKHKLLPPSLHFEQPNPKINFSSSPFFVNTKLTEWVTEDGPRRAGVSSFGIGGTNAHVILEEAPPQALSTKGRPSQLLVLSAKTESSLETATANLAKHLRRHPDMNLADVAYTLQIGRRSFERRRMLVCQDVNDAVQALETIDATRVLTGQAQRGERSVVMMFPGQGTQYVNMAREIYQSDGTFREQVDLCCELLLPHSKFDLRELIYRQEEPAGGGSSELDQTLFAQPALFVIEYALAQLWMRWGVRAEAMIGHSVGEYVAACLAGVMSLEDALSLVAVRGRLMQQLPGGAMLAVPLSENDVVALLGHDERLSLAAVNNPSLCIVSGPVESVNQLAARCSQNGVDTRLLHTSHAFHSEMMEPMLDEFLQHVRRVKLSPPQIPYMSNVTGTWITDAEATTPAYWVRHLRQTVRFSEGVAELSKSPGRIFLEVGPGQTLSNSAKQTISHAAEPMVLSTLPHAHDRESALAFMLGGLGKLWLAGTEVDWDGFNVEKRQRVPLPTYPFARQRYWIDRNQNTIGRQDGIADNNLDLATRFYSPVWTQSMARTLPPVTGPSEVSSTLILMDDCGLGVEVAKRLEAFGQDVVTVETGEGFARVSDRAYVISPEKPEDYDLLLKELQAHDQTPQKIIHMWSISPDAESPPAEMEFSERHQARGYHSLLLLARALGRQDRTRHLGLEVVTNNLHDVTGDEVLCPQKATIIGACMAVQQELPMVGCRSIDIALANSAGRERSNPVEQILGELTTKHAETVVAYRGRRRWVRRFEPVRFDRPARFDDGLLREGGVYLITGGLRGIGLALAEHLARTKAKLILTEDSDFPRQADWDTWLNAHGEQHGVGLKIRKVRELEKMSGGVLVIGAELSDPEGVRAVVREALERFGGINGVLHTEVSSNPAFIQSKQTAIGADALTNNIRGILLLESALKDVQLDFLALFSSASSITGAVGQVDHCATSAFFDSFAHHSSRNNGRATMAIDWDAPQWEDFPEQLLPFVPELELQWRQVRERHGLSLQDGVEAFGRLLSGPLTPPIQVVVSKRSFAPVPEQQSALSGAQLLDKLRIYSDLELLNPQVESTSQYTAPSNQVEKMIAEAWQEVLGIERIGIHDKFFDLGGNSLRGIQLMSRLRRLFLLELPMNILFESPTVAEQAIVVSETRRKEQELEELEKMLKEIEGLSAEDLDEKLALIEGPGGEGVR
ncbi:MAG: beta-ketoacyl synthase N-terminal-like domain-containing protein [Pyrinomonadaceae bacterium]